MDEIRLSCFAIGSPRSLLAQVRVEGSRTWHLGVAALVRQVSWTTRLFMAHWSRFGRRIRAGFG